MISIIVPVYKVEDYLCRCVDSLLAQTHQDIEVILVDDASPDRCGEICDDYAKRDARVKVFHIDHQGQSRARNFGLKAAKGEYIAFVDSDDWVEANMYEVLLKGLIAADADVCVCGFCIERESGAEPWHPVEGLLEGEHVLEAMLDRQLQNYVWNKLYRRELLWEDPFPVGKVYEDILFMHQLMCRAQKAALLPSILYHYRIRSESVTNHETAKTLTDAAECALSAWRFLRENAPGVYERKKEEVLYLPARWIAKVWWSWLGFTREERKKSLPLIREMLAFTKENLPLTGFPSWVGRIRLATFFMHSDSAVSFALLYGMTQASHLFRKKH